MPLRSPARTPSVGAVRSVLPPRKNIRPRNSGVPGCAARNRASVVRAARRLDASISRETGMYLVVPLVVPDDRAKYGIRPGQVTPQVREGRLPVLLPEGFVFAQRHAALVVGDGADAVETMIAAEARVPGVADQAQQGAPLLVGDVEAIEGRHSAAGVAAEGEVGGTADQRRGRHGCSLRGTEAYRRLQGAGKV